MRVGVQCVDYGFIDLVRCNLFLKHHTLNAVTHCHVLPPLTDDVLLFVPKSPVSYATHLVSDSFFVLVLLLVVRQMRWSAFRYQDQSASPHLDGPLGRKRFVDRFVPDFTHL